MFRRRKRVSLVKPAPTDAQVALKRLSDLEPEITRLRLWAEGLIEQNHLSERIEQAWRSQR